MLRPVQVSLCPLCERPVAEDEPYVLAEEHELEPEVTLHGGNDQAAVAQRRFHVEHFRSRIGERVYKLVGVEHRGDA